jgi:hypothetical protein
MNMNDSSAIAVAQRKRRRPTLACERCRRRKIKCNRTIPCGHCVRTGFGVSCTYLQGNRNMRSRPRDLSPPMGEVPPDTRNEDGAEFSNGRASPTYSADTDNVENEPYHSFWGPIWTSQSKSHPEPTSSESPVAVKLSSQSVWTNPASCPVPSTHQQDDCLLYQRGFLGKSHWWNSVEQVWSFSFTYNPSSSCSKVIS